MSIEAGDYSPYVLSPLQIEVVSKKRSEAERREAIDQLTAKIALEVVAEVGIISRFNLIEIIVTSEEGAALKIGPNEAFDAIETLIETGTLDIDRTIGDIFLAD